MFFEVDQNNKAYFNYAKDVEEGQQKRMLCIDAVWSLIKENSYTRKQLVELLAPDYAMRSIAEALKTLLLQQKIEKHHTGNKSEVVYSKNLLMDFTEKDEDEIN